jgi:hypothetical protein
MIMTQRTAQNYIQLHNYKLVIIHTFRPRSSLRLASVHNITGSVVTARRWSYDLLSVLI